MITKAYLLVLIFTITVLSGCSNKSAESPVAEKVPEATEETREETVKEVTFQFSEYNSEISKGYTIETINYDLGAQIITAPEEKDTPYILRGILSYPTNAPKEKLKTVVLIHGCHDNYNERRYDVGFQYVTEYLAENGYLAISIDVNAAYDWSYGDNREFVKIPLIFEEHMMMLHDLNQGNSVDIDLKNKIDLNGIMLVGHSTAGEIIFKMVEENKEKEKKLYGIDYLLSVAPTYSYADSVFDIPFKGLSIVVPEYDGDVIGLDGMAIKNELTNSMNQEIVSTTFLKSANHNYFNTVLKKNDAESTGKDIADQLTMEQQRAFFKKFVVSNANSFFRENKKDTIFDTNISTINRIDGYQVLTYLRTKGDRRIADANTSYISNEQIQVKKETDSVIPAQDSAPSLNMALVGEFSMDLSHFVWNSKEAKTEIPLGNTDFSLYQNISLSVMLDLASTHNAASDAQGLSLELTDKWGKIQKVVIPTSSDAIFYPKGKMDSLDLGEGRIISFWDEITIPAEIRIPLSAFDGIDIKNISKLQIVFDQKEKGAIYLHSIYLMK